MVRVEGREPTRDTPHRFTTAFRTVFERSSGRFYFEFVDLSLGAGEPPRAVIWRTVPGTASMWDSLKPREIEQLDLPTALVALAGVSTGSSAMVPGLLHGTGWNFPLRDGTAERTVVDEAPSIRLEWRRAHSSGSIWLREVDGALLRFSKHDATTEKEPGIVDTTIDFHPIFDEPIHAMDFDFRPPSVQ